MLLTPLLALSLLVSPERQLSAPDLKPAAFVQGEAATASDGEGWLVVWSSGHSQFATETVVAARFGDPTPIVIASGSVGHPAVAFGAGTYLVAWATQTGVRARQVSRDGTPSPTLEIGTTSGTLGVTLVRAAWNGSHFLVAWTDTTSSSFSSNRKKAALLDARGNVVAGNIVIDDGLFSMDFGLAAGAGEFVIADSAVDLAGTPGGNGYPSSVRAFRVNDAGQVSGPIPLAPATTAVFGLRAAFDGKDYLIVWSSNLQREGSSGGARLLSDNSVVPVTAFYSGPETVNTLTFFDGQYVVTLGTNALRLSTSGAPTSSLLSLYSGGATISGAAGNGRDLLAVIDTTSGDVYGRLLNDGQTAPVALSPAHQEAPSIAGELAVWLENGAAMAVSLRGGAALVLGDASTPPVVAFDGSQYLAVWYAQNNRLLGRRVSSSGAAIDPQPFVINGSPSPLGRPAVTFDGENFVVAWETGGGCTHGTSLTEVVARVTPAGEVLEPKATLVGGRSCGTALSLASGTNGSLLVWYGLGGINAAFITRGGSVSTSIPLTTLHGTQPAVAWSGSNFIVADVANDPPKVEWQTVSENGTPNVSGSLGPMTPLQAAYATAATRFGNGVLFVCSAHDVFGLRIGSDGEAIEQPFLISRTEFDETAVGVAENFVVYQRTVDFPGLPGLSRVFSRSLTEIPAPPRRRAVK